MEFSHWSENESDTVNDKLKYPMTSQHEDYFSDTIGYFYLSFTVSLSFSLSVKAPLIPVILHSTFKYLCSAQIFAKQYFSGIQ